MPKMYKCIFCPDLFETIKKLKTYVKKKHGIKINTKDFEKLEVNVD